MILFQSFLFQHLRPLGCENEHYWKNIFHSILEVEQAWSEWSMIERNNSDDWNKNLMIETKIFRWLKQKFFWMIEFCFNHGMIETNFFLMIETKFFWMIETKFFWMIETKETKLFFVSIIRWLKQKLHQAILNLYFYL